MSTIWLYIIKQILISITKYYLIKIRKYNFTKEIFHSFYHTNNHVRKSMLAVSIKYSPRVSVTIISWIHSKYSHLIVFIWLSFCSIRKIIIIRDQQTNNLPDTKKIIRREKNILTSFSQIYIYILIICSKIHIILKVVWWN